jgi:hypothetical protein
MLNSPRRKNLSPLANRTLPEVLKPKTPHSIRVTTSKSGKAFPEVLQVKPKLNLQMKSFSSRDLHLSLSSEQFELKLSEDLKKLNSFYVDSSLNKVFFKDFTFEEPSSGQADRKDAQLLIEWLDFMLQKVQSEKHDTPQKLFDLANEIYSICFVEIIRQVTAHCKERGYLISRVWKTYSNLFEQALKITQNRYQALQDSLNSETFKMVAWLEERLRNVEDQLGKERSERENLQSQLESHSALLKSKTEKEIKLINNLGILQAQYKITKKELLTLKEDARILKVRYENIGAEDEFNNVVKRLVIPKRFKRKTSIELDKELSKDPLISDFFSESDSEIFDRITKYGKKNLEKSIEILFNQDDFVEKATETNKSIFISTEVQTDVRDLCGETVGVKKRQNKLIYSNSIRSKNQKPMYFSEFRPYNQRTLTLEAHKLAGDAFSSELKKKHVRLRRLLSTIKNVRDYQEHQQ